MSAVHSVSKCRRNFATMAVWQQTPFPPGPPLVWRYWTPQIVPQQLYNFWLFTAGAPYCPQQPWWLHVAAADVPQSCHRRVTFRFQTTYAITLQLGTYTHVTCTHMQASSSGMEPAAASQRPLDVSRRLARARLQESRQEQFLFQDTFAEALLRDAGEGQVGQGAHPLVLAVCPVTPALQRGCSCNRIVK